MPAWLSAVLLEMNTVSNLQQGVSRLVQLSGRSQRHVNRLCQQHLNSTSTEVVNRLRIEYAARQFRLSDENVEVVAELVGFTNRSYFSRLFRQLYGIAPGKYRRL